MAADNGNNGDAGGEEEDKVAILEPVSPEDLIVGQPTPYPIYDAYERLLLSEGTPVKSTAQQLMLARVGRVRTLVPRHRPPPADFDPFHELQRCAAALDQAYKSVGSGEGQLRRGIDAMIVRLGNLIDLDADAALGAAHLEKRFPGRVIHPLRQAILCDIVARGVSMEGPRRRALVGAALTANVGMLKIQDELDQQTAALTSDQRHAIRQHPQRSADILRREQLNDEEWLRIVLEHHERLDGSGYPWGLSREHISDQACILMIADSYMAMVTPRPFKKKLLGVRGALRELYENAGKIYHEYFVNAFIKEIGVFPPGTFVGLSSGETALVVRRGAAGTRPRIYVFADEQGQPLESPAPKDLATEESVEIASVYRAENVSATVVPQEAWGYPVPGAG